MEHLDVLTDEFVEFRADRPLALGSLRPDAGACGLIGEGKDHAAELWMAGADLLFAAPGPLLVLPLRGGAGRVTLPRHRRGGRRLGIDGVRRWAAANCLGAR